MRSELKRDFLWNRDKVEAIAARTGMKVAQVYKWWWDQTKKCKKIAKKQEKDKMKEEEETGR